MKSNKYFIYFHVFACVKLCVGPIFLSSYVCVCEFMCISHTQIYFHMFVCEVVGKVQAGSFLERLHAVILVTNILVTDYVTHRPV